MTTATSETATREADQYLKAVAPHLAGLPADERDELLDDLAQHLREIAAEPGPPLEERLGSPQAYAAELLASAGVDATAPAAPRDPFAARVGAAVERARRSWVGQEIARLHPVLRPAWWVLRGYLAVSLLAAFDGHGAYRGFPFPRLSGNPALGLAGVLVAIPLSVRLGQRRLFRGGRLAVIAADLVLAVYALSLLGSTGSPDIRYVGYDGPPVTRPGEGCLSDGTGRRITNLYAYDADGHLLDPVLLYDQNGQPIDNVCPDVDEKGRRLSTTYRQDVNGAPVVNAYPRRQEATVAPDLPGNSFKPAAPRPPASFVPVKPPAVVVPKLAPGAPTPPTTASG